MYFPLELKQIGDNYSAWINYDLMIPPQPIHHFLPTKNMEN